MISRNVILLEGALLWRISFDGPGMNLDKIKFTYTGGLTDVFTEFDTKQIEVFPNPSNHTFKVNLSGYENAKVVISDAVGKQLKEYFPSNNILEIGEDLSPGLYTIQVNNGASSFLKKIFKIQ